MLCDPVSKVWVGRIIQIGWHGVKTKTFIGIREVTNFHNLYFMTNEETHKNQAKIWKGKSNKTSFNSWYSGKTYSKQKYHSMEKKRPKPQEK